VIESKTYPKIQKVLIESVLREGHVQVLREDLVLKEPTDWRGLGVGQVTTNNRFSPLSRSEIKLGEDGIRSGENGGERSLKERSDEDKSFPKVLTPRDRGSQK